MPTAFGNRVRNVRLAKGLTLDELADLMGGAVTKQALSKYEHGRALPRPAVLAELGKALGVRAVELSEEPTYEISCLQFRAKGTLTPRCKERVEATLTHELQQRLKLEDRLYVNRRPGLPSRPGPVSSLSDAEALARKIRKRWNLGSAPVSNLSELFERNSIHVFEIAGEDDFDGLAAVARDRTGQLRAVGIAENPNTDGDRQRFNLAHELAHVVMKPSEDLDEEDAANRFAGAFLVPEELVFTEAGRRRSDVSFEELVLLKLEWRVSIQAILHRLLDLDVIPATHYEWWRSEIRAMGCDRVEPARLPREESSWMKRQIARAEAEGLLSRDQVAAYTRPVAPPALQSMSRRELMRLSREDRHAIMRQHAETLESYYEATSDDVWLETNLED